MKRVVGGMNRMSILKGGSFERSMRHQSRGLGADIFDLLGRDQSTPDILGRPRKIRLSSGKGRGRKSLFTCDQLRERIIRADIDVKAGLRKKPLSKTLADEIASDFGVSNAGIFAALGVGTRYRRHGVADRRKARCSDLRQLFDNVTAEAKHTGFTKKASEGSRARILAKRTTFTCDELEAVVRSSPQDVRAKTLAVLLSQKKGIHIPVGRVQSAVKPNERCAHLRELLSPPGPRSRKGIPGGAGLRFTCDEMEPLVRRWRDHKAAKRMIAEALGVTRNAIDHALNTRCKHLWQKT